MVICGKEQMLYEKICSTTKIKMVGLFEQPNVDEINNSRECHNSVPTTHIDDEYAHAGVHDPKILITTSRDPSSRLQQFAKEMRLMFPNSQRINRGNYVLKEIVDACRSNDATDLIILHEHRGQPGMLSETIFGTPGETNVVAS